MPSEGMRTDRREHRRRTGPGHVQGFKALRRVAQMGERLERSRLQGIKALRLLPFLGDRLDRLRGERRDRLWGGYGDCQEAAVWQRQVRGGNERMVRGVLLDIDGTLLESNEAHAHAWADAFSGLGWEVPFFRLKWLIGMGGNKVLQTIVPAMTDAEGIGKVIATRRRHIFLQRYAPHLQPTPGARPLVEHIQRQGLKTVIATSAQEDELEALLKAAHLADLLHQATTSSDVSASKPSPDIVEAALHKLGLAANEAVMIGDTPYDVEAAQRAGVAIIALCHSGWSDYELQGAAEIYQDPADLLAHYGQSLLANHS